MRYAFALLSLFLCAALHAADRPRFVVVNKCAPTFTVVDKTSRAAITTIDPAGAPCQVSCNGSWASATAIVGAPVGKTYTVSGGCANGSCGTVTQGRSGLFGRRR